MWERCIPSVSRPNVVASLTVEVEWDPCDATVFVESIVTTRRWRAVGRVVLFEFAEFARVMSSMSGTVEGVGFGWKQVFLIIIDTHIDDPLMLGHTIYKAALLMQRTAGRCTAMAEQLPGGVTHCTDRKEPWEGG